MSNTQAPVTTEQWLTLKEAQAYLKVSYSMMTHTIVKTVPHSRPTPKTIRFRKEDLDEFLQRGYHPALPKEQVPNGQ